MHGYEHYSTGEAKLIPLVYALMSSRRQCDYQAVFRTVKEAIEARGWVLAMEEVLADFELTVWHAAEEVFGVRIHACAFHWAAAVQKNAQKYGLGAAVHGNMEQWEDIQRLKQIQFLSYRHIEQAFT